MEHERRATAIPCAQVRQWGWWALHAIVQAMSCPPAASIGSSSVRPRRSAQDNDLERVGPGIAELRKGPTVKRDRLSLTERMQRIRKTDTKPEMAVRRLIHAMGFRYRLHQSSLPGTPDIVLTHHRKVILVHGCFRHR